MDAEETPSSAAPAIAPDLAIETTGLVRRFGEFEAVAGIDLAVPGGSFYGFLGPNGAGKSTTIKCLTGLLAPTSGDMRILGMDPRVESVEIKRCVGVLPEDLALFDRLTGLETLDFVARVHGLDRAVFERRSGDLLELMELDSAANALATDYSHGMRKKLALAVALLPAPRLLFLDEPFEGIDAMASRQIRSVLRTFVAEGGTIFLTSHILEVVERVCDHIGVIHGGKLVAQGPLQELSTGDADQQGRTLEEIFIDLVGGSLDDAAALDWLKQ